MATQSDRHDEPRLPLSRERVLNAAIALADEAGIEALSMRKLGQELGVEAMSLYNHVANKDDLEDGIVEIVLGEIEVPSEGAGWKAALRQTAISSHEVFVRHRWACGLLMHRPRVSSTRMRWMEAVLRTLREAGFSADMTHHAYHALDSHITGFTLWLVSMPFESKEELVDLAEDFLREIPADEYPYVIEHAEQHIAPSSPDGKTEFEFGLDLILDGLERLREAA
ncbi:MAG TPA: TetR/AcrR family transcriptional regulator C-terminal domain-containing protein [Gaiellaceae bacterium]|nr:TetR/AcrR family transcriptional regulator C-terminal domain-containing protein [Gaiellaceae bacterium]